MPKLFHSRRRAKITIITGLLSVIGFVTIIAGPAKATTVTTFRDVHTGWCLDSNNNGQAYTLPCNGGNFQNWVEVIAPDGQIVLRDAQTGGCVYTWEINSTLYGIRTSPCNYNAAYQQWAGAFSATDRLISDYIAFPDFCLDSNFGNGSVGNVYMTPCNGGNWQEWVGRAPS